MLVRLAVFAVAMFGFGFAMVPFYRAICDALGLNGVVKADTVVENTQVDTGRTLTIELDANVRNLLDRDLLASHARLGAGRELTLSVRMIF